MEMNEKSVYQLFKRISTEQADQIAYKYKKDGAWVDKTWKETETDCREISKSLLALDVEHGDKVNILSNTRYEWVALDFGIVAIGGATVGIYASNLAEDCAYIINHSDAKVIFVENQEQLDKIVAVRNQIEKLEHVVLIEGVPSDPDSALTWEMFLAKGNDVVDEKFNERSGKVEKNDLAALVYTSGTTGVPKGVMLSNGNLLFASLSSGQCLPLDNTQITLLFLPLAHVFARLIIHFCMRGGCAVAFAEGMDTIVENLKEIRPHFFASVPRIYEKVYEKITTGAEDAGGLKEKIFNFALSTGEAVSELKQKKQPIPGGLAFKNKIADKLVFAKIKAALGGRVIFAISGAAPLNIIVAKFFHACGINILEGLGMTENTSFSNVNRIDDNKFGTVGQPGPDIEQKIAEDGEVLFRGENVMMGYYKNSEATAETIDKDGWLYTGDIGEIDSDNFLKITDRKKDLIITAGGKNIAPQRVEKVISSSRYINQVVAFGDKKKFLSAVMTLDKEQVESWAIAQGVKFETWDDLLKTEPLVALINTEIEKQNQLLASFESIKKMIILPNEFTIESGELTPSMKIKRKVVLDRYKEQLEALY
ncbi:MAG: long-chain fatty acid--CoA ligase [Calditrichaeota bacterium]|nr:MAG: long-chain fatty acid--CoA ligase [Calditrichota bacterium]